MPGIFTLARGKVRSGGTIVLGFWGDVKVFRKDELLGMRCLNCDFWDLGDVL